MKYEKTPGFDADWKRLTPNERRQFRAVVREQFIPACERFLESPGRHRWPKALRIKRIKGTPGIWEMTWSFTGPDGRATFQWDKTEEGEPVVLWRRIGGHAISKDA